MTIDWEVQKEFRNIKENCMNKDSQCNKIKMWGFRQTNGSNKEVRADSHSGVTIISLGLHIYLVSHCLMGCCIYQKSYTVTAFFFVHMELTVTPVHWKQEAEATVCIGSPKVDSRSLVTTTPRFCKDFCKDVTCPYTPCHKTQIIPVSWTRQWIHCAQ